MSDEEKYSTHVHVLGDMHIGQLMDGFEHTHHWQASHNHSVDYAYDTNTVKHIYNADFILARKGNDFVVMKSSGDHTHGSKSMYRPLNTRDIIDLFGEQVAISIVKDNNRTLFRHLLEQEIKSEMAKILQKYEVIE